MTRFRDVNDVVEWGLCSGCGACKYACSEGAVSLVNIEDQGIRPIISKTDCTTCSSCVDVCPGVHIDAPAMTGSAAWRETATEEFGSALEIWEGYASDPEVRHSASSGGALSAMALYCLENEGMDSVIHTGDDATRPWLNATVRSRDRADILTTTGSRYAPASPCDRLDEIEDSDAPCVFIGKPCDCAAVARARATRPTLDANLGLTMSFFCAGTPSTKGTLELLESLEVSREGMTGLRYRGKGWPGVFQPESEGIKESPSMSYQESWGRLNSYRPFRCHLCPDGLGALADISCGDSWHEYDGDGEGHNPGRSLVVVRTERGRKLLHAAMDAGYLTLEPTDAAAVLRAQPGLLARRRVLFGRLLAMWLLRVPIPKYTGFYLRKSWLKAPLNYQVRSVLGTMRRVVSRRLWRPKALPEVALNLAAVAPAPAQSETNTPV